MKQILLLSFLLVAAISLTAQSMIGLPAQSGTYSGSTRGYWFTSPTCFTITALRVPTDASTGPQSIQLVKLAAPPPAYPTVTNAFTTLFLVQNDPSTGALPVNIQVNSGDIIGILGFRNGVNSYGTSPFSTSIAGLPVTIARFGFQANLNTVTAYDVWTESGGSVSRVEIYYVPGVNASYSYATNGASVAFTGRGDTTSTYTWDFGDGQTATGRLQNHTYTAPGNYNVCLIASGTCGRDTVCQNVNICFPATANFGAQDNGLSVQFTDSSSYANSWSWDFGDGGTSTLQNPTHVYAQMGTYYACLVSSSGCGADTLCDSVSTCTVPVAGFGISVLDSTASFTDNSQNATAWDWDFGDGSTGSGQSLSHTYSAPGTYNVCLYVDGLCGRDTLCQNVGICYPAIAQFSSGSVGLAASFTDASTYASAWSWDFGDGSGSTQQNPSHTYPAMGTYNVCLVSSSACGSDSVCDSVFICVAPAAAFTWTSSWGAVTFSNGSVNGYSFDWDFGDGGTSSQAAPTYTYTTSGMYAVTLITTNPCGTDTFMDSIRVCVSAPVAQFSFTANGGTYHFSDQSTSAVSWSWNFGDGNMSVNQNPVYTFSSAGTFNVCLTVTDACGNQSSLCRNVTVELTGANADVQDEFGAVILPNPVRDLPVLRVKGMSSRGPCEVVVMDAAGKITGTFRISADGDHVILPFRPASGLYLWRVLSGNEEWASGKFWVE